MEQSPKYLMIVAGEPSGDMHAAHLITEIKRMAPTIKFSGVGGPQMQAAGVELYDDLTKYAVIGFLEFLEHLDKLKKTFRFILKKSDEIKPAAVVLVDFPGFNLRLARELKKKGHKVIYYISPQVWASRDGRVETIRKYTDKLLVLFQFEKNFYAKRNITVDFVGHPLLDLVQPQYSKEAFLRSLGLNHQKLTIGLMPGSRMKEIENHLPVIMETANILWTEHKRLQFILLLAKNLDMLTIEKYLRPYHFPIKIIHDQIYDGIHASDLCVVASGTATLEVAILQKPMVVIYKTSFLTWALASLLIKIPYIGLVNVVAGKKIVPECIQSDANPKKIAAELEAIFRNEIHIAEIKSELAKVKASLGEPGAIHRAAESILKSI